MRSTRHVIQKQKESETFCLLQKYFDDFTISQSFKSHQFLQRRNQTRKTTGLVKTESGCIVRSVETGLGR